MRASWRSPRALGLDETERGHLHRLARQRRRRAKAPGGPVRPELLRVLDLVAGAPAPIMGHRLDVLAGNLLAGLLFGRPIPGPDTARHLFLQEAQRGLYADGDDAHPAVNTRVREQRPRGGQHAVVRGGDRRPGQAGGVTARWPHRAVRGGRWKVCWR